MAARKRKSATRVTKKPAKATKSKTTKVVKKATKKAESTPRVGKINVGSKPFTKSEFMTALADRTGLARKDISGVLSAISETIEGHLKKSGPELFSWPGLLKIQVVKKPATKARKGINPFTGEMTTFKAKPASRKVKIRALKQLKEMVV